MLPLRRLLGLSLAAAALLSQPLLAVEPPSSSVAATETGEPVRLESVEVRGETPTPVATPKFTLTGEDLKRLNIRSIADVFAQIPGAQSHTFGQGDVGNPFVLRGFSSDHGSQVAVYIDGVPQNLPSSSVGANGMAEYSWLTPDMIERVEVIEGPSSALYGDQALAGSVNITTKTRSRSAIGGEIASYGTGQATAIYGRRFGDTDVIALVDGRLADGYRDRSEFDRQNLLLKASRPMFGGLVSARANFYNSNFEAPGYLDFDRLRAGLVDPRAAAFATDGGYSKRAMAVINLAPLQLQGLTANVYYDHVERQRIASFAPANTQAETKDLRNVFGTRGFYNWQFGRDGDFLVGYEYRHDTGDHGSFRTVSRRRTGLVNRDYHLNLDAYSVFTQGSVQVFKPLQLLGGLRYDWLSQDVDNRLTPSQSGSGSQEIASPHVGLVFNVLPGFVDVVANYGTGFRSLAVTELSPVSATRAQGFGLSPPQVKSRDVGIKTRYGAATLNLSAYSSTVADEIQETQTGSNVFSNIGNTKRDGYLIDGSYTVSPQLKLDASYTNIHARITNPLNPALNRVTSNPRNIMTAGAHYTVPLRSGLVSMDLYLSQIGPKPYYVGTTLRQTTPYQEDNLRIGYDLGPSSYSLFATYRPRDFASDQAGASFNPVPNFEFGAGYRYTFQ